MKISRKVFGFVAMCVTFAFVASCSHNNPTDPVAKSLIYRLEFKNEKKLGANTANSSYQAAKVIGSAKISGKIHDSNVVKFEGGEHNSNYFSIPTSVLNNKATVTLSMWVKLPAQPSSWNDNAPLFGITCEEGYLYASPLDSNTWNSYAIHSGFNGYDNNLTKVAPKVGTWGEMPEEGTLQSPFGAWQLIGFTFSHQGLNVYQNDSLMLSYSGDYCFKDHKVTDFKIGSATQSQAKDFNGSIADVRVYSTLLGEEDFKEQYELSYKDFLTTDYEFNDDTLLDVARGYKAEIPDGSNAKIDSVYGRTAMNFVKTEENNPHESWVELPKETFLGHNEITVSTNIYVKEARAYQRVFDFASGQGNHEARYFAMFAGFRIEDAHKLRLEYVDNQRSAEYERILLMDDDSTYERNKWMNVTITASKKNGIALYIDGRLFTYKTAFNYDSGLLYDYDGPESFMTLGDAHYDHYHDHSFNGMIDNFKMYSVALNAKEVAELNGKLKEKDDVKAIEKVMNNFRVPMRSDTKIRLNTTTDEDGVNIDIAPVDNKVIDSRGNIYAKSKEQDSTTDINVTFSRNGVVRSQKYTINVPHLPEPVKFKLENTSLKEEEVKYTDESSNDSSYSFADMMKLNADDMFKLDTERLLFNYRHLVGFDTKGAETYHGWINTNCGGEGQFETFYVGALARLTQSMPNYVATDVVSGQSTKPYDRAEYLITEIAKCQNEYAEKYPATQFPEREGYLNAFPYECFRALANGQTGGQAPGTNCNIWVPYYMYHKELMMCYDVYTYLTGSEAHNIKETVVYPMMKKAAMFVYNETSRLNEYQRHNILNIEYGGIGEALYLIYGVMREHNESLEELNKILYAARFFEEDDLLSYMAMDYDMLPGRHVNTQIPKFNAACAAYLMTGDEFYLAAAQNFFKYTTEHHAYADGGSSYDEHYEMPDVATLAYTSNETCCCYNLMRLANYLFKFTGDVYYAHYFEKVFYNHIAASINTEASGDMRAGGKVYSTPTDFGHHKIYSTQEDNAFWCCCCTGQETFAKFTYGNYYYKEIDGDNNDIVYVNMYNPTELHHEGTNLTISGDLFSNTTTNGNTATTTITIAPSSGETISELHLIKPWWVNTDPTFTLSGGGSIQPELVDDYWVVSNLSSSLDICFTKEINLKEQPNATGDADNSYAVFFGPAMMVANLGTHSSDIWISSDQRSTSNGLFDKDYKDLGLTNKYEQIIKYAASIEDIKENFVVSDRNITFAGTCGTYDSVTFTPWLDIKHERFSMYMTYTKAS